MSKYLALAAALVMGAPVAAGAATIYATSVTQYPGLNVVGERAEGARSLGAADDRFMSLGLGGAAVFGFSQSFTGAATISEVTWGMRASHYETARVFVAETFDASAGSFDASAFREVGQITNSDPTSIVDFGGTYRYLAILDNSPRVAGRDGLDIDSVSVMTAPVPGTIAAVPLPASAPLMLFGIAALAWNRRRRAN